MGKIKEAIDSVVEKGEELIKDAGQGIKMSLEKYFEDNMPSVDKYIRAYLMPQFKGEINTLEEWAEKLKNHIKGEEK